MSKDIYAIERNKNKENKIEKIFSAATILPVEKQKKILTDVKTALLDMADKVKKIDELMNIAPVVHVNIPEVQKVTVTNPTPDKEVQKVEVTNHQLPKEVQKVEVVNPAKDKEVQKVLVENQVTIPAVDFSVLRKAFSSLENSLLKLQLPSGEGNKPKSADPSKYVPVRLTNGERFYKALDEFYTVASKGQAGNILLGFVVTGQKAIASTGVAIQLPAKKLANGIIVSALSTNSKPLIIGGSNVSNVYDGTGNGYILEKGASVSYAVTDVSALWVNGTVGDIISWSGS